MKLLYQQAITGFHRNNDGKRLSLQIARPKDDFSVLISQFKHLGMIFKKSDFYLLLVSQFPEGFFSFFSWMILGICRDSTL